jgi:hypothetical protein
MTFDDAVQELQAGKRIQRAGWASVPHSLHGSQAMWIELDDERRPWIFVEPGVRGPHVRWTPSETDKTATDWQIAA